MPHDHPEGRFRGETPQGEPTRFRGETSRGPHAEAPPRARGGFRGETSERRGDAHGPGHNHAGHDHLHSHMAPADEAAELQVLTTQFIDGFASAADKAAYLKLMGVPLEIPGDGPSLKLVDVRLTTEWQVGTASPSFGSAELSYLPFPGPMIAERTDLAFVYVSLREKRLIDLRDFLRSRDV